MKTKYNKFERIAGLFVMGALVGFAVLILGIAIKKGWLEKKTEFYSEFENADGIHSGTLVQISGLGAGQVTSVELTADNKIRVDFEISEKFIDKIKKDSVAQLLRPFVIGERVLEVSVGSKEEEILTENSMMNSRETTDLLTILSGRRLSESLQTMSGMMENLKNLAEAFLDKERTQNMVRMFDRVDPLLKNLNVMSVEVIKLAKQANKDEKLGVLLSDLSQVTQEVNKMIPEIRDANPDFGKNLSNLVQNMDQIAREFKVLLPALAEIAPDLPKSSRRAVEALNEAVVLIKAMQKSYFVRSGVKEVLEEEGKSKRQPAEEK